LLQILHSGGQHLASIDSSFFGQVERFLKAFLVEMGLERLGQMRRAKRQSRRRPSRFHYQTPRNVNEMTRNTIVYRQPSALKKNDR